jgi:hypothetical protein
MKLPQYEQQLQVPGKEIVQPIEQAFGIQTAQAKQDFAEGIQQAASNVGDRLIEMENNNQQLKANKLMLEFSQKVMMKKNDSLAKTGENANGLTTDFTKWYDEESKNLLKDIPDKFKEQISLQLAEDHIQGQGQISTHELAQQRAVTVDSYNARIALAQQNVAQNSTPANYFLQSKSIKQLFTDQGKVTGEAPELTQLKIKLWHEQTMDQALQDLEKSNQLDSALLFLKEGADSLGGSKSQEYVKREETLKMKIENRDVDGIAKALADQNFKTQKFDEGLDAIDSMKKSDEYKEKLRSKYREQWGILAYDKKQEYNRVANPIFKDIQAARGNLIRNNNLSLQSFESEMTKRIKELPVDEVTKTDMTTKVSDVVIDIAKYRSGIAQTQATRESTAEQKRLREISQRQDELYDEAYTLGIENPGMFTSVADLHARYKGKNRLRPSQYESLERALHLLDPNDVSIGIPTDKKYSRQLMKAAKNAVESGEFESTSDFIDQVQKRANEISVVYMDKTKSRKVPYLNQKTFYDQALSEVITASKTSRKERTGTLYRMNGANWTIDVNGDLKKVVND